MPRFLLALWSAQVLTMNLVMFALWRHPPPVVDPVTWRFALWHGVPAWALGVAFVTGLHRVLTRGMHPHGW